MKVKQAVEAYKILKGAKLTKVEYNDKFKVVKAMISLRPVAEKYEKDEKDGLDALKGENFEAMQEKATKHNEATQSGKKEDMLSYDELRELNKFFADYQKEAGEFIKSIQDKDVEVSFDKVSEEAFGKLVDSNDFTGEDIMKLYEAIV